MILSLRWPRGGVNFTSYEVSISRRGTAAGRVKYEVNLDID